MIPRRVATPPGTVIYAIGDIHGRADLLQALQQAIVADAATRRARRRVLVYLGDYVSRGSDSPRVVELARAYRPAGFDVVTLKGNHEDLLLRYLEGDLDAGRHWFDYDGLDTLADYGVDAADRAARDEAMLESLRRRFAAALPAAHLGFFRTLKTFHRAGGYYFVHAGIHPGVPLEFQRDWDRMWIRARFLESDAEHGALIVHGHSISTAPEFRHNRIGIDTGAYASGVLTCLVLDGPEHTVLQT